MSENKNHQVVIAEFESEAFANYGIDLLKKWDYVTEDVSLGAIGVISKKDGKVETHVPHQSGKGAKAGAVVGVLAALATGGTSWIVGMIGGSAIGAAGGGFFKKSLHLGKDEVQALGEKLDEGKVLVVVTCDEAEVEAVSHQITQFGGDVTTYEVPEDAVTEAAEALAASATVAETVADTTSADTTAAAPESTPATEAPSTAETAPTDGAPATAA